MAGCRMLRPGNYIFYISISKFKLDILEMLIKLEMLVNMRILWV